MLQYQVLSDKQINHNSLVWNTPSLLFVAQAFLWDIALNNQINMIIRCCVSLVSIIIGFASLQSFVRSQLMEIADSEQLYEIEKMMSERNISDVRHPAVIIHHQLEKRTIIHNGMSENIMNSLKTNKFYRRRTLSHLRTFYLWEFAFWITLAFAIVLFLYNIYVAFPILLN